MLPWGREPRSQGCFFCSRRQTRLVHAQRLPCWIVGTMLEEGGKGLHNTLAHVFPGAWGWLAKQPHGGIPWRVGTMPPPTPIGGKRQQGPDRFAHGSGQMGDGSINRNHQIEVRYHCRGVSKIAQLTTHIVEDHSGWRLVYLPRRRAGLQTEQCQVREVRQRRQGCQ